MFKTMLLAGTMIVAAPVLAQETGTMPQATPQTMPAPTTTEVPPMQEPAPATAPEAAMPPAEAAPATEPAPATPATDDAQEPAAAPEAAAAATPGHAQVAQVVDQQFGTYDKNGDGTLDKTEFAAWMDALKTQANVPTEPAQQRVAWNDAAFKQADGDKSASVTKTELTGFLVKGASGQS